MTLDELRAIAEPRGIHITPHGYVLNGRRYPIDDWTPVLRRIAHHDPVGEQIAGWLRSTLTTSERLSGTIPNVRH